MLKIFPRTLEPLLPGGPLSPAYEIKEAPGKGRGLFAKRDIEMGEAIVVERPMLVFPQMMHMHKSGLDTDVHNFLMMQLVQGLTNEDKSLLSMLNNCRPWYQNPVGAILGNAITITLPGHLVHHHAGLFPIISMVNHSCGPNSAWRWDHASFSQMLYAVRGIPRGAEITASYHGVDLPRRERREMLKELFAFDCTCPHCTRSDTRRLKIIKRGYETLTYWGWLRNPQRDEGKLLQHVLEVLNLVDEEGLRGPCAFAYYFQLAAYYGALGKEREMKEWGFRYLLAILPLQGHLRQGLKFPELGSWIDCLRDPPRFFPDWKMVIRKSER